MPRLTPIDPATATGEAKVLLDGVQKKLGVTPNLLRTLANAPAALKAYLGSARRWPAVASTPRPGKRSRSPWRAPMPASTARRPTLRSRRA